MWTRFKKIFEPPAFEGDESKTRTASQVNFVSWTVSSFLVLTTIAVLIVSPQSISRVLRILPIVPGSVIILVLLHRGHIRLAAGLTIALGWLMLNISAVPTGGVRAVGYTGNVLVVLGAGLWLGYRHSLFWIGMSILAGLAMIWADLQGWLPSITTTPISVMLIQVILLVISTGILQAALTNIDSSLRRFHQELAERKKAEQALALQNTLLAKINEITVELGSLSPATDLYAYLATKLKDLSGASVVTIGEYIASTRQVILRRLEGDLGLLSRGSRILGFDVTKFVTDIDEKAYQEIMTDVAGFRDSFTAVTFGGVSPTISKIIQTALGIEKFAGIAYIFEGALYGTSVLAFKKGVPLPSQALLRSFASIAAVSLRRQQMEKALRESEERFHRLSEAGFEGVVISDDQGKIVDANTHLADMLGCRVPELIGMTAADFVAPESIDFVIQHVRSGSKVPYEHLARRKDGSVFFAEAQARTIPYQGRSVRVTAIRDITERKRAEEKIQSQIRHLGALHTIDNAITSHLNVRDTLSVLLEQVTRHLGVDAADVLIFDSSTQILEYAAGVGFQSNALQHTRLRLGEGYAGAVVAQRAIVSIPDLAAEPDAFVRSPLLASEGFQIYLGAPLVVKEQVKGVLEIFHRAPFSPDQEWLDFMKMLATQTAVAIDNKTLFENLQRSNVELARAYDTTLEGWSRALELRDRETEGHTIRATALTVRLAHALRIAETDLQHVRRGALLHDIGKLGIPDSILGKPGPLTEDEWVVMRKHPIYAYDLLMPIPYLKPAIDIPYCHHEKWDGTGYPRRLRGEQIPLAARIFAVVDVWDALCSERPYRSAWPVEKVRAYIRSSAGTHFDPDIVELFLKVADNESV